MNATAPLDNSPSAEELEAALAQVRRHHDLDDGPPPKGNGTGDNRDFPGTPGDLGDGGDSPCRSKAQGRATSGDSGRLFEAGTRHKNGHSPGDSGDSRCESNEESAFFERAAEALHLARPIVPEYPVTALGPLQDVVQAIATNGQVDVALAAHSILATTGLLAQGQFNVRGLAGVMPVHSYFLSIGDSGDGKTYADNIAQHAVQELQRAEARMFKMDLDNYEAAAKKDKGPIPREPYRIMRDGTVEGIRKAFVTGIPSQAVFFSDAAAMLCGYGMTPENKLKTAGTINHLFDDGEISTARAGGGRIQLYDRRLSIHWMIQPVAVSTSINDQALAGIGFWPRFIVAWPNPAQARKYKPYLPEKDPPVVAFWDRCRAMLSVPLGEDCSRLPVITLTDTAEVFLGRFFERVERQAKEQTGTLRGIKPFAIRSSELAARLAGVLAAYSNQDRIDFPTMRNAITLVMYGIETWLGIFGRRAEARNASHAMLLLGWLFRQPGRAASEQSILHIGPKELRSRDLRDSALALLEQKDLVVRNRDIWSVKT